MTSFHRQLQVAADTICGTLPQLWRPEWEHVARPDLADLLGAVYRPYGRLAEAVSDWWADPTRDPWDKPADHAAELEAACGWDPTDSLGFADPLLPATVCRHWVAQLAKRLQWRQLRGHGDAILHALEHGRPPSPADLERLLAEIAKGTDGARMRWDEGSESEHSSTPATYREFVGAREVG